MREKREFRKHSNDTSRDGKYPVQKRPGQGFDRKKTNKRGEETEEKKDGPVRLNRFIANAGVCSRREADELISAGRIQVNGKVVTEMGFKVQGNDFVQFDGKKIFSEKPVYILLNKPKDFITTKSDERGRKTVMDLVRNAGSERIFPVGRLDKNTTGLLLLTNDGDLTKKLTHPSYNVRKLYQVSVDKEISDEEIEQLRTGFDLEDGFIKADKVSRVMSENSNRELGLELHSGRNRIVRRMMEHLGFKVLKLDRAVFATLTKKDLPRGKWRRLTPKEVSLLKTVVNRKSASRS
jgi:23S rRNA pseudouridine2605 synthase